MANKLTETRRSYSWWWDSHISPKNSKWLQENLTDTDAKVKAMIKIINEDADSFARRAEMYYKKRPELMKLVEEFYRAYRALAERYDHATGELRLAHRTMIEAFPNQMSFMMSDDPPSPLTSHLDGVFEPDELNKASDVGFSRKGLKQLHDMFQSGEATLRELKKAEGRLRGNIQGEEDKDACLKHSSPLLSEKNHGLDLRTMILNESERAAKVEAEMQRLKQDLAKMEAERDTVLAQYRQTTEQLSVLEKELNSAQVDAKELEKCASEAQSEVKELKESLHKLEVERDSSLYRFEEASKRISSLEAMVAAAQGDATKWRDEAVKAETESQNLKQELLRSEAEKQDALARYQESLDKISALEARLRLAEQNADRLSKQNDQAESEIKALKEELTRLNKEKEDAYLRYQQCLEMISKLQNELMEAKEEVRRLNGEILFGSEKLKGAEGQCALLEEVNQSLKLEANDLVQEIAVKDQQLSEKHTELEKLMNRLQDEQSRFMQVEATLNGLQNMHFQSQEEQRALAEDLRDGLRMLKDLELCKRDLQMEIQCLREENRGLNGLKLASSAAEKGMQDEILSLKEIKEKLEAEVRRQAEQNEVLQQQFHQLKEELEDLYKKYQDLLHQLESAGINPESINSSIKDLQDQNSRLKHISDEEKVEKEALLRRLEDMEGLVRKSAILNSSLSDAKAELESSKEKMKILQESCNKLGGEKSSLVTEKSALLSQLQIITESMQKLLEKNVSLENSLQCANIDLEGLRVKSKSLEDFCQYLKDEKSNLQSERSGLVHRLERVEKKLEKLETRFTKLEDKYAGLEKERDSTRDQVQELRISLVVEKQERECVVLNSDARLSGLENRIHCLQEENKCGTKELEEQLEKAVSAQVEIFILKKFMKDMEERNYTLFVECQKHKEATKFSEMIISELECENMMQHLETEYLLDRADKLRRGICQVLKALEIDHVSETDPEIFLSYVRGSIKDIRRKLLESKDENQDLLIHNNVLAAVIRELSLEGLELKARKEAVDHELFLLNQQHPMLEDERDVLQERGRQLEILVAEKERGQETLKAQMESCIMKQEALEKKYVTLQREHRIVFEANEFLQENLTHLEDEKHTLEEENSAAIVEALSLSNQSVVFKSSWVQTSLELGKVSQDMSRLQEAYSDLEAEARSLGKKLAMKETENIELRELVQHLEEKNKELILSNDRLNKHCLVERERINQKEDELVEAEKKITTMQDKNTEFHTIIDCLQVQCKAIDVSREILEQQIVELSECKEHQGKEIVLLREANGSLENEVGVLTHELEACKIREVILNSELHERSSEFELWEAEATSFYFDLQISSVREALLEKKVQELSELCEDLVNDGTKRSVENERLHDRISFLESEKAGLNSKLSAYVPVIASLKGNIATLEQTPALQTKLRLPDTPEQQAADEQSSSLLDGLSELQNMQSRIKAIESILIVEKASMKELVQTNIKLEAPTKVLEKQKSRNNSNSNVTIHDSERKSGNLHSRSRELGIHMKDIPLDYVSDALPSTSRRRKSSRLSDQLLELWETSELDSSHSLTRSKTRTTRSSPPRRKGSNSGEIEKELGVDKLEVSKSVTGGNRKAILERLASDAQKLASLQISVQELRRKMDLKKKSKAAKDVEYKRLKGQVQEFENSVVQLVSTNTELTKTIKGNSSTPSSARSQEVVEVEQSLRRKMSEQARRDSEKVGTLQLEMQKIQSILLKLEDEKNDTKKSGKSGLLRSHTGIILREFVYGRSRSRKQKKPRFCGCFRQSHKEV